MNFQSPELLTEYEASELKPVGALVISKNQRGASLATLHKCGDSNGQPVIGAGKPVSAAALKKLVAVADDSGLEFEEPPKNLIASSQLGSAWFVKSAVRPMWFRYRGKKARKMVAWPNLIFVYVKSDLFVFSYKGTRRPSLKTKLHFAPLMNIYQSGSLCWGDVPKPKSTSPIKECEAAIFESLFGHENHGFTLKGNIGHRLYSLYSKLDKSGAANFPSDQLRPMDISLGEFLSNVVKRRA